MTNHFDRVELEKHLRAHLSSDFSRVSVGEEDETGMRHVFLLPKRLLTQEELVSACKEVAPIIRKAIPEKPDHGAVAIVIQRTTGQVMGAYYLGWAGRADEARFFDRQTDHADWLALYQRLRTLLLTHGVEKPEGVEEGDFSLDDEDNGLPRCRLVVHEIEFLTPQLVADIQALLKDGFADWYVVVRLILSLSEQVPPDGIVIRADEIQDQWDWPRLKRKLGDRLKV